MTSDPTEPTPARSAERAGAIALAVSALYVLALAYPVHLHVVGVFSDFYRWYAPDADRISAGQLPQNTYNPPGYPALLALGSRVTGDHFSSGKWLSLLAAGLTGVLAFSLHRRLFGAGAALLAVPIILSSEVFTRYAVSAMTDVPFVCVTAAALLAITDDRPGWRRSAILAGVLSGVATLLRYNGAFLLVPGLIGMLWRRDRPALRLTRAAIYLGSFLLTVGPWLWVNHAQHGSPVYSTNYQDVARALGLASEGRIFNSLADLVLQHPGRFAWSYAGRVVPTTFQSLGSSLALLPVGPLAVAGIGLSLLRNRRRPVIIVLVGALAFLVLMSLTHWETRYFFFLLLCYSGFAAYATVEIAGRVGRALGSPSAARLVLAGVMLWILVPSSIAAWRTVAVTLSRQPLELLPAAHYLDRTAPRSATVMAVRARIAYLSRRQWRELPPVRSVDQLRGMLGERPPEYLVYDRWTRRLIQPLSGLANPDGSVPWLRPVYHDPVGQVTIYAVELDR